MNILNESATFLEAHEEDAVEDDDPFIARGVPHDGYSITYSLYDGDDEIENGYEQEDVTLRTVEIEYGDQFENFGRWFDYPDAIENYRNGQRKYVSIHPPKDITPEQYEALARRWK